MIRRASALATIAVTAIGLLAAPQAHAAQPAGATSPGARPSPSSALPGAPVAKYVPAACNTPDLPSGTARCFAEIRATAGQVKPDVSGPPSTALGPADIQAAYDLPSGGAGQTVAVVDAYGDSTAEADLAVFRAQYGLPACTTANGCFRKVDQDGGTDYPADDSGWALETSLDLDAVSSACPLCDILLVEGNSADINDLGAAAQEAVSLGAKFISNSYGISGEEAGETNYDHFYDHPGVAVTASTGDLGNVVNWPASDPGVVAVGGTTLTRDTTTARGWTETAWSSGGSGCSPYEPQPAYQNGITTDCPTGRAIADIAADADPDTGLAVYDSLPYNSQSGWFQVGGTSLSSPLIASMYALAGDPSAGTNPASYPYSAPAGSLTDITSGSDGSCGNVLCQAGPGWDGPTGNGTPYGVAALTLGAVSAISGTVTDAGTSAPIPGASIVATGPDGRTFRATTDAQGAYSVPVSAGEYDVSASMYGYTTGSDSGVRAPEGGTADADIALKAIPSVTVTGQVTDGGEHGWPLSASVTIDGYPYGAISTDPFTGRYSVKLPENADYTFNVASAYPGYQEKTFQVSVGAAAVTADAALGVDLTGCTAPGYSYPLLEDFEGWTGATPQDGWTVAGSTPGWEFDNPQNFGNLTGGSGNYATAAPYFYPGTAEDTTLTSPAVNLTGQSDPQIAFDDAFVPTEDGTTTTANVDVSTDGGSTWTTVGEPVIGFFQQTVLPIPQAAGQPDVEVRIHYAAAGVTLLQIDHVTVGNCAANPGGLAEGIVSDANTGQPITGATVGGSDPADSNGFTWSFQTPGRHTLTASAGRYTSSSATVSVAPNAVTRRDWDLQAGQLRVSTTSVSLSAHLGGQATATILLTDTGRSPVDVSLGEHEDGYTPPASGTAAPRNAPLLRVRGSFTPGPATKAMLKAAAQAGQNVAAANPAGAGAWTDVTDYPTPIIDSAAGYYEGKVYSVAGFTDVGVTAAGYVYDPATAAWSSIAPLPAALDDPAGIFLDGTMYVVGGWTAATVPVDSAFAYDPQTNTWTTLPPMPLAVADPSVAALDGQLYVVGGCLNDCTSTASTSAFRYDPATRSWSMIASYPTPEARAACAGIDNEVVCAGGLDSNLVHTSNVREADLATTYAYQPSANTWVRQADMPYNNWGMAYAGANNRLQVAGGINLASNSFITAATNQASQFDPVADSWSALPNANSVFYRPGSACGLYQIGGATGLIPEASPYAEVLPGYDLCGGDSVPWLNESRDSVTLAPGQTTTVTLIADTRDLAQIGSYAATLSVDTDAPYSYSPIPVHLTVTAPRSWNQVTGTVTDAGSGTPIADATVTICGSIGHGSSCGALTTQVQTNAQGIYDAWLPPDEQALTVTANAPGYTAVSREVQVHAHETTTADFALSKAS